MRTLSLNSVAAIVTAALTTLASADTLVETFPGTTLDAARWTLQKSGTVTAGVRNGLRARGTAGDAGVESVFAIDWNDNWSVRVALESESRRALAAGDATSVRVNLGMGALDLAAGYQDGVTVEIQRTSAGRQLVVTTFALGAVADQQTASIGCEAAVDIWYVASTGTLTVSDVRQGNFNIQVPGVSALWAGLEADPMHLALMSGASGTATVCSEVEYVSFAGDFADAGDADDAAVNDADANDATEPPDTYVPAMLSDDDGDGEAHGDSHSEGSHREGDRHASKDSDKSKSKGKAKAPAGKSKTKAAKPRRR